MDITENVTEGNKMDQNKSSEYSAEVITEFLTFFSENTYSLPSQVNEPRPYMDDVMKLLEKDYFVRKIENVDGKFCPQYPAIIPIMEGCRYVTTTDENLDEVRKEVDVKCLAELFEEAKLARCRQRFPVPVILLNNEKYICRSSTLASEPEICYRTGLTNVSGYELLTSVKEFWWPVDDLASTPETEVVDDDINSINYEPDANTERICDKVRNLDIKLLKTLGVDTIVDIMVENRKVKHGLYVSASEKVDSGRYSMFKLVSLPFPGCEFFKKFYDAMFNAEGLKYDFTDLSNDAVMNFPPDGLEKTIPVEWQDYKEWDIVNLTQNYFKYILRRLEEGNSTGLLLHCISGWDRTPLFISMLRLSLWADNLIHTSLNEYEILYLTLTYDWYLFGHYLSNRLCKNEEIMAFCFDFLKYIASEEFSKGASNKEEADEMQSDASINEYWNNKFSDDPLFQSLDRMLEIARQASLPMPIPGARQQRRDSTESVDSNSSSSWQLITETGSIEEDLCFKSTRYQRLIAVRKLFNACYYKALKRDNFGPKEGLIEEVMKSLSGDLWRFVSETENGNDEKGPSEMNVNAEKDGDSNN